MKTAVSRLALALGAVVALVGLAVSAQSTAVEGGKILVQQPDGAIALELIGTSTLDAFNALVLGRADPGSSTRADVDFKIVDPLSSLSPSDPSLEFNASGAGLVLGSGSVSSPGADGDLLVQDGAGVTTIALDGGSANAVQLIDPADTSMANGFVKAWAKIDEDGSVVSCWNCNTDVQATRRLALGKYQVDFLLGNIGNRPVLATVGTHSSAATFFRAWIGTQPSTDVSAVLVETETILINFPGDPVQHAHTDQAFTLFVF